MIELEPLLMAPGGWPAVVGAAEVDDVRHFMLPVAEEVEAGRLLLFVVVGC